MNRSVLIVTSAAMQSDIDLITDNFAEMLGHPVDFNIVIDNNIIGGFLAFIDGTAYDACVRSILKDMRYELLSSHS